MLTSEGSRSCAMKLSVSSTKESSMICTPNWSTDWLEGNKVGSSIVGRRNRPKSSPAFARKYGRRKVERGGEEKREKGEKRREERRREERERGERGRGKGKGGEKEGAYKSCQLHSLKNRLTLGIFLLVL